VRAALSDQSRRAGDVGRGRDAPEQNRRDS
jgi:hypothetical protein